MRADAPSWLCAAVGRGFPLSSYGFVSVPARNAPAQNAPARSAFCPPFPALLCVLWLVSSYGTNSVFGGSTFQEQWWRFNLYLISVSRLVGGGCWLRAYDVQRRGLCIRASHQYCTEAMSEVGCNSSPILTWKIDSNCEVTVCVIMNVSLITAFAYSCTALWCAKFHDFTILAPP